jgi:uncharacterized protein YaiL (DUF2058 family)
MAKLTLQEQMLKAGLVNEKKLKKAKKGSKKSRTQAREVKAAVEEQKQQQLERDKALSEQQKEQKLSKEVKAQVKQLVQMNKLDLGTGEIKYNFTDGILAIARFEESYAVIPSGVADKITQRDERTIIDQNVRSEETVDEDDPYADFVVPDDLMW